MSFINLKAKCDLVVDHPSQVIGAVRILGIHGSLEFFQWPFHPFSQVEVDAADGSSAIN